MSYDGYVDRWQESEPEGRIVFISLRLCSSYLEWITGNSAPFFYAESVCGEVKPRRNHQWRRKVVYKMT